MGKSLSIFVLVGLLSSSAVFATTFTSFSVTRQIDESGYVVHGRIGAVSTRYAAGTQQPYTYWNLDVEETLSGSNLSGRIEIRQPGGEVGGIGYRVAGSANFQPGEDVVVFLRDTDEAAKEVVGLQSGKYNLVEGEGGKTVLKNSLGVIPNAPEGGQLDLDSLRALAQRVNSKDLTDADRKVMVDVAAFHRSGGDSGGHGGGTPDVHADSKPAPASLPSEVVQEKPVEDTLETADRQVASQSGPAWIGFVVAGLFLICAVLMYRLLTKKPST